METKALSHRRQPGLVSALCLLRGQMTPPPGHRAKSISIGSSLDLAAHRYERGLRL